MLLIIIMISGLFVVTLLYAIMVYLTLHSVGHNEADPLLGDHGRDRRRY